MNGKLAAILGVVIVCLSGQSDAQQKIWRFDFGLKVQDPPKGFVKVTKEGAYSKEKGWGFEKLAWNSRSFPYSPTAGHKYLDAISRDGVMVVGTFAVDVPNGDYLVWTLVGDLGAYDLSPIWDHISYGLNIEGEQIHESIPFDKEIFRKEYFKGIDEDYRRGVDAYDHFLAPLFEDETHEVTVQDGQLTLKGGHANLCAMLVFPAGEKAQFETEVAKLRQQRRDFFYSTIEIKEPEFDGEAAPLGEEERQRGYRIWPRHKMKAVKTQTQPEPDELSNAIKAIAAQDQTETATFVVRPLVDLRNVQIEISDLVSDEGEKIPASTVQVRDMFFRINYRGLVTRSHLPDFKPRDLAKEITHQFWLTFHLPKSQKPGIYVGKVAFRPANRPPTDLIFKVKVLGFRLVNPYRYVQAHLQTTRPARFTYQQKSRFPDEFVPGMKKVFQHLKGLGMLPEIDNIMAKTVGYKTEQPKVEPTEDSVKVFEELVAEYARVFPDVPVLVALHHFFGGYWTPRKRRPNGWISSEQPEKNWELMKEYLQIYIKLREKHPEWPPLRFVGAAEMSNGGQDHVLYGKHLLEIAKSLPGLTMIACPNGAYEARTYAKIVDIIAPNYAVSMTDEAFNGLPNEKTGVWVYQAFNRFCHGFYTAKIKATGSFKEFYNTSDQRPYNSFDGRDLWCNCALPTPDGMVSVPLIEEMSWGITDLRYIKTLEEFIAAAKKSGKSEPLEAAKDAEAFMAELLDEVNPDLDYYLNQAGWWDDTVYDIYRWMVAEKILKIQEAMEMK